MWRKKKKLLIKTVVALFLVLTITLSYAFLVATPFSKKQNLGLSIGTMSMEFEDNDAGINESIPFGGSIVKKFVIKNSGSLATSLSLEWKDLVNTYLEGSLSYNLTYSETENGVYKEVYPETNMPTSDTPIRQTLCSEITVPAETTYYYNLTITLNDLEDVEQSSDLDASLNTGFIVDQPKQYRYYRLHISTNGGIWSGGSVSKEALLKNNETYTLEEPTRTGYTFDGWNVKGLSSRVENSKFIMGMSETYLYAKWIPEEYTLTINKNDGSSIENKKIEFNTPITIETPEREGYTFTGWEVTGGTLSGNEFTLTTAGNASLNATWEINKYKYIVYHNQQNVDGNGYTLVSADTDEGEAEYNTKVTPETKTYTGFTSPEKQELTIEAEDKNIYPPVLNKVNYEYPRNKYTLTIDPNGGTYKGSTSPTTESVYYGANKILSTGVNETNADEILTVLGKTAREGNPTFTTVETAYNTEDGLYSLPDDYGTSYYYRGAATDNYVKFGGFYWRIIRINGDGSLRMIYDGTKAHKNGEGNSTFTTTGIDGNTPATDRFINNGATTAFNTSYDDNAYIGWMYGTAGSNNYSDTHTNINNSNVKSIVDTWYRNNLLDYDEYIADAVYCNDRSIPGKTISGQSYDTELGYSKNFTSYGQLGRFEGPKKSAPQFACLQKNDAFTVNDETYGNAIGSDKSYKVGLVTADEVVAAGSPYNGINRNYYLYKSSNLNYWTMTPDSYFIDGHVYIADIRNDGHMHNSNANAGLAVAPVISLKAEYALQLVGEGTASNPFEIPENVIIASSPTRVGYNFTGWEKTSGSGTLDGTTYTMGAEDATIKANYDIKKYTITFNPNGGVLNNTSKIVTFNEAYGDLPIPTYPKYEFLGWYTAANGGKKVDSTTVINKDQTLYAHWELANLLMAKVDNEKIWKHASDIKQIVFETTMEPKTNATYTYDISSLQNGSVMSYLVLDSTDTTKYITYIQANGTITANPNSSYLFSQFKNMTDIFGLENLDTSNATTMAGMFSGCNNLNELDLKGFNTSKVTNMSNMFDGCTNMKTLDISSFNTSKVIYMSGMFAFTWSLTSLNISNFNTSNVVYMNSMFLYNSKIKSLDLSNFDTSKVKDMNKMFSDCSQLNTLDLRNWNVPSATIIDNMLTNIPSSVKITVSNTPMMTWLIDSSDNPKLTDVNFQVIPT